MDFADPQFLIYVLVGFLAQIVDGALGMAYGTLSATVLLTSGVPPAIASASVHTAQFFTTGLSGISHALYRNVNWRLCAILVAAGIVGGLCGVKLLTSIDGKLIQPWVAGYLLVLGLLILWRTWKNHIKPLAGKEGAQETEAPLDSGRPKAQEIGLGLTGGFLDAIGGGGWGPIVTSGLLIKNKSPRYTIGSVNTAEFFVKTATAAAFFVTIGFTFHNIILGLLLGGVLAAPLGAMLVRKVKPGILMGLVGLLVVGLSLFQLIKFFF